MITFINYYLWIGVVWLVLHELLGLKMNNGMRVRLWLLWPFTVIAWIIGFIEVFNNDDTYD